MRAFLVAAVTALAACTAPEPADDEGPPACTLPAAPDVRAVAGPGPGMSTFVWDHVEEADGYELVRGDAVLPLQRSRAVTVHSTGAYTIIALGCGAGAASEVTPTFMPGTTTAVQAVPVAADVSQDAFPVFDAGGDVVGERAWRIVQGTGNCCENYVATDRDGRIYDFGGTFLHVSEDEGETWSQIETPIPYATGEGAVVAAPNGDVVGIGWSPYTGDQLWAHKYVAAEGTWHYAPSPLHSPFFDRPWIATIEGPFEVEGVVAPYLTIAISNFQPGVVYLSLDGLHYTLAQSHALSAILGDAAALAEPERDGGRDWTQPLSASRVTDLGDGHGVVGRAGACGHAAVDPGLTWGCAAVEWPGQHVVVDGAGTPTAFAAGDGRVTLWRLVGEWQETTVPLDVTVEEWDAKVSAVLDQAVVAIHGHRGQHDVDLVVRFRGLDDPVVEVLQVGAGDSDSDSGVLGDRRFDFTSVGFLPDGRVAVSFTDAARHPPAIAVEMPGAP